jgi:hypothetical protein
MFVTHLAAAASLLLGTTCATVSVPHEAAAIRNYFYVGGGYVGNATTGHLFANQMYVEKLVPSGGASKPYPIVFIHGQAQTGTVGSNLLVLHSQETKQCDRTG